MTLKTLEKKSKKANFSEREDIKPMQPLPASFNTAPDRCQIEICRACRKHASCILRTINGDCQSFEEGPAWDHVCAEFKDTNY